MEKGKSSRLKRKTTVKPKKEDAINVKTSPSEQLKHIEKVQPIVLTSDSEEDCGPSRPKQRNATTVEGSASISQSNLSGIQDGNTSSLQKLKKLLCSLSSEDDVNLQTLKPFPPYPQSLNGEKEITSHNKGTLLLTTKDTVSEELPPFPKPCKTCMKLNRCHEKMKCDSLVMDRLNSISEAKDMETNEKNIRASNGSCVSNICELKTIQSVSPHQRPNSSNDEHKNALSALENHRHLEPSRAHPSNCDKNVRKTPSESAPSRSSIRPECEVNNSHLMRDRNSNLYSLQSRNQSPNIQTSVVNSGKAESSCSITNNTNSAIIKPSASGSSNDIHVSSNLSDKQRDSNQRDNKTSSDAAFICDKSDQQGKQSISGLILQDESSPLVKEKHDQSHTRTKNQSVVNEAQSATTKIMQSCPMCQVEFPNGTSQLDIDSHLAACLSSADDDFNW